MITTRPDKARRWVAAAGMASALAILLSLGTWQVQRLQWKTALIEELTARLSADAVAFPVDLARVSDDLQFLRVRVSGRFKHDGELELLSRTRGGVVGMHLMVPLEIAPGRFVLVDRGWVRDPAAAEVSRPPGEVEVEGVIRTFQPPGRFTPDNDPVRNMWFNPDLAAMAEAAGVNDAAPVYVTAIAPDGVPAGDPPGVNLRNSHLAYAITWYSLALVLLVMAAVAMVRGRLGYGRR